MWCVDASMYVEAFNTIHSHIDIIMYIHTNHISVSATLFSTAMNLSNLRSSKNSILDKQLTKGKNEVSLSLFALVFSEIIQYSQKSCSSVAELQDKIHSLGYDVGSRLLDLYVFREKNSKRETKLINMLLFIKTTLWKVRKVSNFGDPES